MTQYLIHPYTRAIVAELIPDKEIIIHDAEMLERIAINGIVVSKKFQENYQLKSWKVYPTDSKEIFAKAFAEFKFIYGLRGQGYEWKNAEEPTFTDVDMAEFVFPGKKNKSKIQISVWP